MGLERLISLMEAGSPATSPGLDAYLVAVGDRPQAKALSLAEKLRDAAPGCV